VGQYPSAVAAAEANGHAFVTNEQDNNVSVLTAG